MKESDLNSIIANSFREGGWFAFKIPDPHSSSAKTSSQLPFDGFALYDEGAFYWESKLMKGDYRAFPFSSIQPHQLSNLSLIGRVAKESGLTFVRSCVMLGVWKSRDYFDLYAFDMGYIIDAMEKGSKSILKKDLLSMRDRHRIGISNRLFDVSLISERVVGRWEKNFM